MTETRDVGVTFADIAAWTGARTSLPSVVARRHIASVTTDSRKAEHGSLFVAVRTERDDGHLYVFDAFDNGAEAALVSDVSHLELSARSKQRLLKVNDPLQALQRAAREYRRRSGALVIGVTGSSGKTTTRTFITGVLGSKYAVGGTTGNLNNHIGVPISLLSLSGDEYAAVIEMGANHLGEIHTLSCIAEPDIAVITNVGYAHVGLFGSIANTTKAKLEIVDGLDRSKGLVVLNGDDSRLLRAVHKCGVPCFTYGLGHNRDLRATDIETDGAGTRFTVEGVEYHLKAVGRHFVYAALPAVALGLRYDVPVEEIQRALGEVAPPEMRGGIREKRGVTFVLDCYNANPSSMNAGLDLLGDLAPASRRVAVLGDMLELGRYARSLHGELGRRLALSGVREAVIVGEYAETVAGAASEAGMPATSLHTAADVDGAVEILRMNAREGDTVLLKASRRLQLEHVYTRY